jgi:major vault protein
MPEDYKGRDTELILPPGVFSFVLDQTKGHINTLCGPIKQSLSNTDQLVVFNPETQRFVPAQQQNAIQTNVIVPKGSYVVMQNPANNNKQPEPGKAEVMPIGTLRMGQIENLPGPQSFPLWPGQVATVVKGHHLRTNQYLLGRVYDDEAAKANWDKSVVKSVDQSDDTKKTNVLGLDKDSLVTGQLIVIRGTNVAFYIPPTGVEILMDENNKYVRDAVTLERLEYSILLDENGNKEYKIGPDVVFPSRTQQFYTKDGNRKFRAFELQPTTGIHIKVIADYTDEVSGESYTAGNELFITGETTPIYYPREEHAIISYGGNEKSFAVAIPSGEGRYVLDRLNGNIDLVEGPKMFLPNPIKQVVVRRILTQSECELYFPGNEEVQRINAELRNKRTQDAAELSTASLEDYLGDTALRTRSFASMDTTMYAAAAAAAPRERPGKGVVADALKRGTTYTPPRTITLDTKCDGAVRIDVWSGFAAQVVNSKGIRRTVIGPQTILLQYDEYLERLSLSTGKPKNSDKRLNQAFLRYISNPVSDIISLKTQDLVNVDVQVKYLVRFEETDKDLWFSVDNYVQYMVDHLRSMIGNTVRNIGVQEFYSNAANILRDTVLGTKVANGERPLKHFKENGMTIYDLELISVQVKDNDVANLLSRSRQETLVDAIELERAKEKLALTQGKEEANRQVMTELASTAKLKDTITADSIARVTAQRLTEIEAENTAALERTEGERKAAEIEKLTKALYLDIKVAEDAHTQDIAEQVVTREIKKLMEEANAAKTRTENIPTALVEALVALAQSGQFQAIAEYLAPLSIVRGESLSGTLTQMFAGTPLEGMVNNISNLSKVKTAAK